jgi:hypothetical protein
MQIELMGLIVTLVGMTIFLLPIRAAFLMIVVCTVFGAASAISLPVLGGASILVPNLFLVFFVLRCLLAFGPGPVIAAVQPPHIGFALLILTVFCVLTAFTYPYFFQGDAQTMIVQRTAGARNVIALLPLQFTSNNITQSVYAIGGLVCFVFTFGFFSTFGRKEHFITAIVVVGAINLGFAVADIVTHFTRTEYLLGWFRTANYALLTGAEKGGLKRISGSFPEASAFADYTIVVFSVSATLWLARVRSRETGMVAGLSLVFLVFSTSATALLGIAVMIPLMLFQSFLASHAAPESSRPGSLIFIVVAIPFMIVVMAVAFPEIVQAVHGFVDEIVLSKSDSQSGRERSAWNDVAYRTFLDTAGLGAGLGSARASSYGLVLLSNIGVPGLLLFSFFVITTLALKVGEENRDAEFVAKAAKNGIFAALVTAMVSGTGYDLGLVFYILAGFVAAQATTKPVPQSPPAFGLPYAGIPGQKGIEGPRS